MKQKDFESLFKKAPELEPREGLKEEILAYASSKAAPCPKIEKPRSSAFKRMKLWIPIAACFAIALLVLGGAFGLNNEKYQTVYIDVNPSVAVSFNRFGNVSGVEYLNDDAKNVLSNVELDGMSCEEAMEAIVVAYDEGGYFENEALMLISADEGSEELVQSLKSHAEKIKGNKKYTVGTQSLTKEEKELAKGEGISPGKYRIITEIIEKDGSYTVEELKDLTMSELNKLNKSLHKESNKNNKK